MPPPITVVSGLPRSGTSMMMQMLAAGGMPILTDHARAADDDNPRGYYEFEPVKKTAQDASWLRDAPGKAVKIIYALLRDLPAAPAGNPYRVLFLQRPLEESVRSQQVMLERLGRVGSSLSPEEMRAVFERELESIKAWLAEQPGFDVLYLDYPAILAEPETQARCVCAFLGADLNLDPSAMAAAVDARLHRQKT